MVVKSGTEMSVKSRCGGLSWLMISPRIQVIHSREWKWKKREERHKWMAQLGGDLGWKNEIWRGKWQEQNATERGGACDKYSWILKRKNHRAGMKMWKKGESVKYMVEVG